MAANPAHGVAHAPGRAIGRRELGQLRAAGAGQHAVQDLSEGQGGKRLDVLRRVEQAYKTQHGIQECGRDVGGRDAPGCCLADGPLVFPHASQKGCNVRRVVVESKGQIGQLGRSVDHLAGDREVLGRHEVRVWVVDIGLVGKDEPLAASRKQADRRLADRENRMGHPVDSHQGQLVNGSAQLPFMRYLPFDAGSQFGLAQHRLEGRIVALQETGRCMVAGHGFSLVPRDRARKRHRRPPGAPGKGSRETGKRTLQAATAEDLASAPGNLASLAGTAS